MVCSNRSHNVREGMVRTAVSGTAGLTTDNS